MAYMYEDQESGKLTIGSVHVRVVDFQVNSD